MSWVARVLDVKDRCYEGLSAATWGAAAARIVPQIRAVQREVEEALERERLLLQIRMVLGVDDAEAVRLAEQFDPEEVIQAGRLGWKPSSVLDPRLFILGNRVTW